MGKVSKAEPHLSLEAIQAKIHHTKGFWRIQKWLTIWHAAVDPAPARTIALHTGLGEQTVHNLIAAYNRYGPSVVEGIGKGGRRRAYLSWDDEVLFLDEFLEKATRGEIVTTREIHRSFEQLVGRTVNKSTISRLLKRHEWRAVVPRPVHEQANPQEQETFKKNLCGKSK
jgi:transposase